MLMVVKRLFAVAVALVGIFLFLKFPDLDIRILGIGAHRNFLFHSAAIVLVFYLLMNRRDSMRLHWLIINCIIAGCGIGIGIHLAADLLQSKAVLFPFVGSLIDGTSLDDRLWLGANSAGCFLISFLTFRRCKQSLSLDDRIRSRNPQ
jgi:hypothetical protein